MASPHDCFDCVSRRDLNKGKKNKHTREAPCSAKRAECFSIMGSLRSDAVNE